MQIRKVDVAVLGGGTAGLAAWRAAQAKGVNAVIIEGGPYGTTCARVGCMPSKLLIAAADAAHAQDHAQQFGVQSLGYRVDGQAVMARVRSERERFVGFVLQGVENIPEQAKIHGYARFINDFQVQVGDDLIVEADRFVIATGSSPAIPKPFLAAKERLIVNDDLFEWQDLPRSVAVFGAGVIGLELGQALHRLGVRVKLFSLGGTIGPISDPVILAEAQQILADDLYLDWDAQTEILASDEQGVLIRFYDRQQQQWQEERFDYLLAATGRVANVGNLGLENTSLVCDSRSVPLFDRHSMQCGQSHVFMAGDANNDTPLLHEAADEGRIAGDNAARFPDVQPGLRRTPLSVVFCQPQIAMAGLSYQQALALHGHELVMGEVDFSDQGRSRVMGINQGRLRLYACPRTQRLLGMEMIGPAAEHLVHLLAWSIQAQHSVAQLLEMPFYHPVIEEGLRTALRDLASNVQQLRQPSERQSA